ncbi:MAG: pyridoxal phosphate-dependent aminotransferase [bacterium]
MERAFELKKEGRDITFMCVGEPDIPPHPSISEACERALKDGKTGYTHSLGIIELREAIANYYHERYGVLVSPEQIVVSSGTSPLMTLIFSMLVEKGDEVILTNPCYACYPNFVNFVEGKIKYFNLNPKGDVSYSKINSIITDRTTTLIINSPSNPTGEIIEERELEEIAKLPLSIISDEIYHGLCYEGKEETLLKYRDDAFIINGFSKSFSMTGWRLGYTIIPERFTRLARSLHQNLVICAPNFVQWAGIAALKHYKEILASVKGIFSERRSFFLKGLKNLGLEVWGNPRGAFYIMVDFRFKKKKSLDMAMELLENYDLAVTPGIDFGPKGEGFIRLSYATSKENIERALSKLEKYLKEDSGCEGK